MGHFIGPLEVLSIGDDLPKICILMYYPNLVANARLGFVIDRIKLVEHMGVRVGHQGYAYRDHFYNADLNMGVVVYWRTGIFIIGRGKTRDQVVRGAKWMYDQCLSAKLWPLFEE